jgi:hypothetical protein
MRYEFQTATFRYKVFEPGECIRATSRRSGLDADDVLVVTRCVDPSTPGYGSIVFVEGRKAGLETEYLTSVDDDRDAPSGPGDAVRTSAAMGQAADAGWNRIHATVAEAGLDRDGVLNRLLAFLEAYGLGEEARAYLAAQHQQQIAETEDCE